MQKRKAADKTDATNLVRRYVLTGAALGLYFGLFFRPVREPSLLLVVGLSLLAAAATVGLRLVRGERPSFGRLLKDFAFTWGKFALVLAIFEGRHLAHDFGGRMAVTLMTTALGALTGWLWAYAPGRRLA